MRQDRAGARQLGLDREAEWAFLELGFLAGMAPEPLHVDFDRGLLVTRFVPGPAWTTQAIRQFGPLQRLGTALRALHRLPATGRRFDPMEVARRYARCIEPTRAEAYLAELAALATDLYPDTATPCLCHHDPHAGNLVGSEKLVFLDWEYAALGEPLFDLAVVDRTHQLTPAQRRCLFEAWCDGFDQTQYERLLVFGVFYDALAQLWQAALSA